MNVLVFQVVKVTEAVVVETEEAEEEVVISPVAPLGAEQAIHVESA